MEKGERKPYTAKRWTDIPKPIVTGKAKQYSEEEQKQKDLEFEQILKEYGVLKSDEHLTR